MGWFDFMRGRHNQPPRHSYRSEFGDADRKGSKSSENLVESLVEVLSKSGRVKELEVELARLQNDKLSAAELESWHRYWGIASFQRGDRSAALQRFKTGVETFPGSSLLQFSLGQEYEYVGDIASMNACFEKSMFPSVPGAYALAQARYAYLWNQIDNGIRYIEPLLATYLELRIADDTFLYLRGMPFLGETWAYLACFQQLRNELASLRVWTEQAAERITDFDFARLLILLDCAESQDFRTYIQELDQALRNGSETIPKGYIAIQAAMLQLVNCTDIERSEKRLIDVVLRENDFPWLEDMRLLGRCEVASFRGESDKVGQLKTDFLLRQPLLFEPSHAFDFGVTSYQEDLKVAYQASKNPDS